MAVGTGVVILDKDGQRVVELDAAGNLPFYVAASGDIYNVDKSRGLVVLPIEHHRVHQGSYYGCGRYSGDVDVANPMYINVQTPNVATTFVHFVAAVDTGAAGLVQFFENPTISDNGVSLSVINFNRGSGNTAGTVAFHSPVVSNDGTLVVERYVGGGTNPASAIGGNLRHEAEYVLKVNENYLVKFTADAANTKVAINCEFYESSVG